MTLLTTVIEKWRSRYVTSFDMPPTPRSVSPALPEDNGPGEPPCDFTTHGDNKMRFHALSILWFCFHQLSETRSGTNYQQDSWRKLFQEPRWNLYNFGQANIQLLVWVLAGIKWTAHCMHLHLCEELAAVTTPGVETAATWWEPPAPAPLPFQSAAELIHCLKQLALPLEESPACKK